SNLPASDPVNAADQPDRHIFPEMGYRDQRRFLRMLEGVVIAFDAVEHPPVLLQHADELPAIPLHGAPDRFSVYIHIPGTGAGHPLCPPSPSSASPPTSPSSMAARIRRSWSSRRRISTLPALPSQTATRLPASCAAMSWRRSLASVMPPAA